MLYNADFFKAAKKLADNKVTFDACITDAPYGEKTHKGYDEGMPNSMTGRSLLGYKAFNDDVIAEFVDLICPIVKGWIVFMCSHEQIPAYERALRRHGRYVFAPVTFIGTGKGPRITGDGPASWAIYCIMSRPKTAPWSKWGSLPGAYVQPIGLPTAENEKRHTGGKCLWIMKRLIEDYTKQGMSVLDPCAGAATTEAACIALGRTCTSYEIDKETYRKARKRLDEGVNLELFK